MNVSGCTLRVRCILHYPKIDLARKTCLPDKRRVRNIQYGPTGTTDCAEGTAQLAQNGIRLIFVTLGANGVFYRFGDKTGHVAGVPCKVGDTNGAGDTFFGAALSKLCKEELDTLTVDKLESILAFANKAASITTSRHGAIPAMPTLAEVEG